MKLKTLRNGLSHSVLAIAVATGTLTTGMVSSFDAAAMTVFDPTNYTQNFMTQLRAVQSNVNELQQLQRQLEQLKYMAENTKSLVKGDWDTGADAIGRLSSVLAQGQALAVSGQNFSQQFKATFPGFKSEKNFGESYAKWNQTTRDSVMSAMQVANMQMTGIRNEQDALEALRAAANSTTGQKQSIDVANQVALNQIRQMQGLRELMVAQMQAEGTHIAAQTQTEATKQGAIREVGKYHDPRKDYKPNPNLCGVPPCKGS